MAQFKAITVAKKVLPIVDAGKAPQTEAEARDLVTRIALGKRALENMEAKRKELNAPHQQAVKENGARFALMKPLGELLEEKRQLLLDWLKYPGADEDQNPLPEYDMALEGKDGGVAKLKSLWDFEVVDEEKLRESHPELFVLDASALKAAIRRKSDPVRELPGVRIYDAKTVEIS